MSEPQGPRPGLRIVEEKHGRRDVTIPHLPGIPELTLWEETLGQECPRPHLVVKVRFIFIDLAFMCVCPHGHSLV